MGLRQQLVAVVHDQRSHRQGSSERYEMDAIGFMRSGSIDVWQVCAASNGLCLTHFAFEQRSSGAASTLVARGSKNDLKIITSTMLEGSPLESCDRIHRNGRHGEGATSRLAPGSPPCRGGGEGNQ